MHKIRYQNNVNTWWSLENISIKYLQIKISKKENYYFLEGKFQISWYPPKRDGLVVIKYTTK